MVKSWSKEQVDEFTRQTRQSTISDDFIKGFAWGAFSFPEIYMLWMRSNWHALVAILLPFLPSGPVRPLILLLVALYFAIIGRRVAWAHREWTSFEQFRACQSVWDQWGKVFALLRVIGITGALLLYIFGH